ncbi:LysM peptidoglycan-binding domain-containing protein [Herbidospora mongoliensis]|uniref:LysM peptidoglycan-binding domain-containing protein n=1 Tax=Herbidospora mongoliensis TaxID=688067 RepID=UPI0014718948|nr:LysM peptidoglycan-binding domain-containing protein [Herbidospora mongoliensis]
MSVVSGGAVKEPSPRLARPQRWGDAVRPPRTEKRNAPAQVASGGVEAAPIRLTRRGRIVLIALIAALSLVVLWLGTRAAVTASTSRSVEGLPSVTVQEGDTLWGIAVQTGEDGDPAVVVREIMDLNGLPDPLIRPGTTLYLPGDGPGQ